jgi:hypothetical protein
LHGIPRPKVTGSVNQIFCMSYRIAKRSSPRTITRICSVDEYEKRNFVTGRAKLRSDFVRKDSTDAHSSNHKGAGGLDLQDFTHHAVSNRSR